MDFSFTHEQRERMDRIRAFAREELSPGARDRIREETFDRALWEKASEFGLAALPIPEKWGGSDLGALDTILAVEALGTGCADGGLVFSLCAHSFACAVPVWKCGTDEQHREYLSAMANGDTIAANAISEPEAGSDVYSMKSSAERDGDTYLLNGTKRFITNAPVADLFLVYALTDREREAFGASAFLVPADTPGLSVEPEQGKTGLRTAPWGRVFLNDCRVPSSQRLGAEGAGRSVFQTSMIWERGCLFAMYVGAMDRTLEQCTDHVKDRVQFDQPIGENQSVSNRLVDMRLRLETSRLLLYRAGWYFDQGEKSRAHELVALSKLWISECAVASGEDAIQIFGARGILADNGIDTLLRDSLPSRIFSGTTEIQRNIIAKHMGIQ